jgi:putative transposase
MIDEFIRACLAVRGARLLIHKDVIDVLYDLFCERGVPVHIRSDNGSEFTAKRVCEICLKVCPSNPCLSNLEAPGRMAI